MIRLSRKKIRFGADILIVYEPRLVCCPISSPSVHAQMPPPSSCTVWQPLVLLNRQELCKRGLCNKMASASSAVKKPNSKAYLSVMVLYGCGRVAVWLPSFLFVAGQPRNYAAAAAANWFKVGILIGLSASSCQLGTQAGNRPGGH